MRSELRPKLLVSDADAAIDFYVQALGAELTLRIADEHGIVNHAELTLGSAALALAQSVAEWGWLDPGALGGSPVLMMLTVADPDVTADRMVRGGSEVVIPIENRAYGKREGRVRDPFGHLWVVTGDPK